MADQTQSGPKAAKPPRRRTALDEIVDTFEALAKLIRARHSGYSTAENGLAVDFLKRADDLVAKAKAHQDEES